MNEKECLTRMVAPGQLRPTKWLGGVIQICITRMCDLSCFGCTQGSNLKNKKSFMTPEQFEIAVKSLVGYTGVVGIFGGNPAVSPHFNEICSILREYIPFKQRGLWCNNPLGKGKVMRETFNPSYSNLNVHLNQTAYDEFKRDWPESMPCGLHEDSRHSPPYVAMKDVVTKECPTCKGNGYEISTGSKWDGSAIPCRTCNSYAKVPDESKIWELISTCDVNQFWSAYIGTFRGQVRAYFCEIAGAQASLHEDEPDYPDTGIPIQSWEQYRQECTARGILEATPPWWKLDMTFFSHQVRKHCFDCGIPLRGKGELAQSTNSGSQEQVSETHKEIYHPKKPYRSVEVVTNLQQLGTERLDNVVRYLQNSHK